MLSKVLRNKCRCLAFIVLVAILIMVRVFENELFYDPFLDFFKKDFENFTLPAVDHAKLALGLLLRYGFNTIVSTSLIYIVYQDFDLLKFILVVYAFLFVVLMLCFFIVLLNAIPNQNWILFYIRRFLIQPIFLLLFFAGIYYQKRNT
ncbi:MAG: exosortase F system-associated membrane protein [Flavobacterium sp.]